MNRVESSNGCRRCAGDRLAQQLRAGFTLVELMVVVAVIAILSALAYPSYTSYVVKTHRKAAEGCLSEYANYMERFYTSNLSYSKDSSGNAVSLPNLDCKSQTSSWYTYSFPAAATSTTFTVQAVPVSGSIQATKDTDCGTLTLDNTGARTPTSPTSCWQ